MFSWQLLTYLPTVATDRSADARLSEMIEGGRIQAGNQLYPDHAEFDFSAEQCLSSIYPVCLIPCALGFDKRACPMADILLVVSPK